MSAEHLNVWGFFKAKKPFSPLPPVEAVPISKVDLAVKTLYSVVVDGVIDTPQQSGDCNTKQIA